ncbi:MAG: interleukin-like EMT inducer domain-containing protein, partial [Xenococcaceae cyanobacterium]
MSQTNITVKVHSAGYSYGNSALITLNDREIGFDNYSRGLNVAVFNESSGQNISCTTFDTYAEGNSDSFALFVENLPLSRIVAIAVKDEASRNLSERAKRACESLGSSLIHNLQYQGSWAMIGQKGAAPGTAEESLSNDSSATASRSIAVESVSAKSPTISATSAGGNHGNMAQITMNGNIVSIEGGYQRGLNVVIFDESNGNQLISQSFNLLGKASEAEAFAKLIEDLPVGRVVAIAVKDEASINLSERAKRACESIGSRMIHSLKFRCSWAIVGYKGASPGSVIENLNNSGPFYNSGPVSVKFWMSSIIPPNGEDTVVHLKTRRGGEGAVSYT